MSNISLQLGRLKFQFATASELRDALLASFADADFAGGPLVVLTLDDARKAWSWTVDLLRRRSDWQPALGIALQHATHDGGDLARTALTDLLANFRESVVLLEWTEPLAHRWPDARSTSANTGWGGGRPDARLADIVQEQKSFWATVTDASNDKLFLEDVGPKGGALVAKLTNEAELASVLSQTAKVGTARDGSGPWSWLTNEMLFRPWMPPVMPRVAAQLAKGSDQEVQALLDWLGEEWDLWRLVKLLEGWKGSPPAWWSESATKKPAGWKHPIRPAAWSGVSTLGDVASQILDCANAQAASPPVVDLSLRPS